MSIIRLKYVLYIKLGHYCWGTFSLQTTTGLLYYTSDNNQRLCVPATLIDKICKLLHDDRAHIGACRTYDMLRHMMFFHDMRRRINKYVADCPECQKAKPRRGLPYGDLQPVPTPRSPLSTLCLDFIVGLPMTDNGIDAILLIVDKFTKFIRYILGKTTWTAEEWATAYIDQEYSDWGLPFIFVHDVDPKLMSVGELLPRHPQGRKEMGDPPIHIVTVGPASLEIQAFMTPTLCPYVHDRSYYSGGSSSRLRPR